VTAGKGINPAAELLAASFPERPACERQEFPQLSDIVLPCEVIPAVDLQQDSLGSYLRLMAWVSKRYRRGGAIVTHKAGAVPTRYTVIEGLAWSRYCGQYDVTSWRGEGVTNG